jgi:hypothetical protein
VPRRSLLGLHLKGLTDAAGGAPAGRRRSVPERELLMRERASRRKRKRLRQRNTQRWVGALTATQNVLNGIALLATLAQHEGLALWAQTLATTAQATALIVQKHCRT